MSVEIIRQDDTSKNIRFKDIKVGEFWRVGWIKHDYHVYVKISESDAFNLTLNRIIFNVDPEQDECLLDVSMEVKDKK